MILRSSSSRSGLDLRNEIARPMWQFLFGFGVACSGFSCFKTINVIGLKNLMKSVILEIGGLRPRIFGIETLQISFFFPRLKLLVNFSSLEVRSLYSKGSAGAKSGSSFVQRIIASSSRRPHCPQMANVPTNCQFLKMRSFSWMPSSPNLFLLR